MTVNQAKQLVDFILNKNQRGYSTGDQFNLIAPAAQLSLISDRLGNVKKYRPHDPTPEVGFSISQKWREELGSLMVKPTTIAVAAGVVTKPADYLYYDVMTNAANGKIITEATADEIVLLNNSSYMAPSALYPKFVVHSNGFNIYPTTGIANVNLAYVRKAADPFWNFTLSNDREVYNASGSQDFETNIMTHLEIIMRIVQPLGVNLTLQDVTQYALAMEAQGK